MSPVWMVVAAAAAALATYWLVPGPPALHRAGDPTRDRVRDRGGGVNGPAGNRAVLAPPRDPTLTPTMTATRRFGWGAAAGAGVAAGSYGWWGWVSIPVGLAVGVAVAVGMGRLEPARSRRRRWLATVHAPQVLDLIAAGLQAGLPLRAVVAGVVAACDGPVVEDLERVVQLIDLGMSDAEAWRSLADHPQLGAVALDLSRSVDSGTRLADALSVHAADARQIRRAALEVEARKVGVRSVLPLMTCFIPAFLLLGVVPTVASALQRGFSALG